MFYGLLDSLRSFPEGRGVAVNLFDMGLEPGDKAKLAGSVAAIVDPGWDLEFTGQDQRPGWFKAYICRPFIPRHFPGYDAYLWLDSDMWVQDWAAVHTFLRGAERGRLAAVPTYDRNFCKLPSEQLAERLSLTGSWWEAAFGPELARRHYMRPSINGGAFALAAGAPHWREWRDCMTVVIQKYSQFMIDQITMNWLIYERGLPLSALPMTCNWMCNVLMPQYDTARQLFVAPGEPYERIGIMHLSGIAKRPGLREIDTTDGGPVQVSLRYDPRRRPG